MIAQNELSRISLPIPHPREIIMQTREDLYAVARYTLLLLLRRLLFLLIRRDLWLEAAAGRQGLMRIHVTGLQNARGGGKRRLWLLRHRTCAMRRGGGMPPLFQGEGKDISSLLARVLL